MMRQIAKYISFSGLGQMEKVNELKLSKPLSRVFFYRFTAQLIALFYIHVQ